MLAKKQYKNRHSNTKTQIKRYKKMYPGLSRRHYERGTFKEPGETSEYAWDEDMSREDFAILFGSKKIKQEVFGNPSHKAFGDAFTITTFIAFVIAIVAKVHFELPIVFFFVIWISVSYMFWMFPNNMIAWSNKRKHGKHSDMYTNYERDLYKPRKRKL